MAMAASWNRFGRALFGGVALALLVGLCIPAWRHFYPVTVAEGWTFRVSLSGLEKVSALLPDGAGGAYLSEELGNGQGRLLRSLSGGTSLELEGGLSKPDGMVQYRGGIAFSQEEGEHPVSWLADGVVHVLFTAINVEGLATDGHHLYAIEDRKGDGRLLRYAPTTGEVSTLRDGLEEGEGVAVCPDGQVYYSEKQKGIVHALRLEQASDPVVLDQLRQPGYLLCNGEGLWVSEDATHQARLLLWDRKSEPRVVLDHLRSAQTLVEVAPGRYLLAEQGRNRVLELRHEGPAEKK
ncbi:hypothetical protein NRL37_17430 [Metapseudomonas otitidis]|uniref:hypothetical protein n=1 Tax=Metapseudomonas otitidis TaxID=319939 RepID=UPI00227C5645|nr:hypothetical protein [Pseudomonas otitidis]WAF83879.1 hypothetical protein NRL37_17430 [Pseudomonas otitidis]